jgi:hypothetical protein
MPPHDRGLLARLDALVADRHAVELRAVAEGVGLVRVRGEGQVVGLVAGGSSARNVRLWPQGSVSGLDLWTHSDPHGRPHRGGRSPGKAANWDAIA